MTVVNNLELAANCDEAVAIYVINHWFKGAFDNFDDRDAKHASFFRKLSEAVCSRRATTPGWSQPVLWFSNQRPQGALLDVIRKHELIIPSSVFPVADVSFYADESSVELTTSFRGCITHMVLWRPRKP